MPVQDITIVQGSTFEWLILVLDVDDNPLDMVTYTGGTAGVRGSIRKKSSDLLPLVNFTIQILNNTGVLAAKAAGRCHLTAAQTAALEPDASGSCYALILLEAADSSAISIGTKLYDIEIEDPTGYVFQPYSGSVFVTPEITK